MSTSNQLNQQEMPNQSVDPWTQSVARFIEDYGCHDEDLNSCIENVDIVLRIGFRARTCMFPAAGACYEWAKGGGFRSAVTEWPNTLHPIVEDFESGAFRSGFEKALDLRNRQNADRFKNLEHENAEYINRLMCRLQLDWEREYRGKAHVALRQRIADVESCDLGVGQKKPYAKTISLLQSSGMGKSRLVSEMGKSDFLIPFVFRSNGETGYPPKDGEITQFMTFLPDNLTYASLHSRAVGILAASMKAANNWISNALKHTDKSGPELRQHVLAGWQTYLAPRQDDQVIKYTAGDVSSYLSQWRGKGKAEFCSLVVADAKKIMKVVQDDDAWRLFHNNSPQVTYVELRNDIDSIKEKWKDLCEIQVIKKELIRPAQELMRTLSKFDCNILLFSFDESSNLFKDEHRQHTPAPFTALRRILGVLLEQPIWTLFLSTESEVYKFAPAVRDDISFRIFMDDYQRYPPFYAFPLDIEMYKVIRLSQAVSENTQLNRITQLPASPPIDSDTLASFNEMGNMARIGRPLWWAYRHEAKGSFHRLVIRKLLNRERYDPTDKQQVFAVVASRINLDPYFGNTDSAAFVRDAVNSHLRVLVGMKMDQGVFETLTPSEPVVAHAAAVLLTVGNLWPATLQSMLNCLIDTGIVDRGNRGELYTRIVLVIGRDTVLKRMNGGIYHVEQEFFHMARPFKVIDFLRALFTEDFVNIFDGDDFRRKFETAYLNFTHFTYTKTELAAIADDNGNTDAMEDLLFNLMRSQAALQLAPNQCHWDHLLPVYLGDPKAPLNRSKLSAILVQTKNRSGSAAVSPAVRVRKRGGRGTTDQYYYQHWAFFGKKKPILTLVLDIGREFAKKDRASEISNQGPDKNFFGARVVGCTDNTYGCLKGMFDPNMSKTFLIDGLSEGSAATLEQQINNDNARFRHHTTAERFMDPEEKLSAASAHKRKDHPVR